MSLALWKDVLSVEVLIYHLDDFSSILLILQYFTSGKTDNKLRENRILFFKI